MTPDDIPWGVVGVVVCLLWIALPRPLSRAKEVQEALHDMLLAEEIHRDRASRRKADPILLRKSKTTLTEKT